LTIAGTIEKRPGIEASARELEALIKICREQKVRLIALEPQYPPKAAEALIREIRTKGADAKTVVLDPLETALPKDFDAEHQYGPDFYERKMKENIDKLADALK